MIAGQVLDDVSEAIAAIYGNHFDVQYTAVKTYLTENLLVCVLEDLGSDEDRQSSDGDLVVRRRQNFQRRHELEFRDAVERLTGRRVKTFLSANHVGDGVALKSSSSSRWPPPPERTWTSATAGDSGKGQDPWTRPTSCSSERSSAVA